jgi:uncharacterized protein YijF (DUF1287 family)
MLGLLLLLAGVPAWVDAFVAHYQPNGRARSLTAAQCTVVLAKARGLVGGPDYDPAYVRLRYPQGDVPDRQGVCADVLIRSFRAAALDLQQLVHDDLSGHFGMFPGLWKLRRPDANIDHRRVPNLMTWFARNRASLPLDRDFQACDAVAWDLGEGVTHIGIVTDRGTIVHHISGKPAEEDVLHAWRIIGHFAF